MSENKIKTRTRYPALGRCLSRMVPLMAVSVGLEDGDAIEVF
jgi:hypothetical protein